MLIAQHVHEIGRRDPKEAQRFVWENMPQSTRDIYLKFRGRQECARRAMAKPLPGPAASAFTKGAIEAGGKIVNRVVPAHFAVLQALNSPLLKLIENATTEKKSEVDFDDEQQWQICYIFTTDAKQLRSTLKSKGVEAIKKEAESACGEWSAAEINFVMLAIVEQLKRHVETTVKFAAEMEANGDVHFFREQNPPTEKPADSAG